MTSPVPHTEELLLRVRRCESSGRDITLCYQCFGDPSDGRPAVLLVCGLNMQLYAWDEVFCEDLVRAGFFVIRYDNRDIGYSTKIEDCGSVIGARLLLPSSWASVFGEKLPYTMDDMAKDGLALLSALQIPRAHVFGISMGGVIAQLMGLLAPDVVMSLTSLMSTTNPTDLPDSQMWVKLHMLRSPPKDCSVDELLDFRAKSLKKLLPYALPVDDDYLKHRYSISLNRSSYGKGLVRQAAALRRCPSRDEVLKKLTIPALIIHGAQDLVVPPNHGFRTAMVIPHARMLVLKSMGHYYHPAFFHTIVVAFADMASTTAGPGFLTLDHPIPVYDGTQPPSTSDPNEASTVTPKLPQLMASMSAMLQPVVTTPSTRIGAAAVKAANTAVPGVGDPMMPEAVILDLHNEILAEVEAAKPSASSGPQRQRTESETREHIAAATALEEEGVLPYIVGSPSTWNRASFPSPIRKTDKGGFVVEGNQTARSTAKPDRSIPAISGTPLKAILAAGKDHGTETTGGRRSRSTSRRPSFRKMEDSTAGGIAAPMPLPTTFKQTSADEESTNIDSAALASAEDVATTFLPPL